MVEVEAVETAQELVHLGTESGEEAAEALCPQYRTRCPDSPRGWIPRPEDGLQAGIWRYPAKGWAGGTPQQNRLGGQKGMLPGSGLRVNTPTTPTMIEGCYLNVAPLPPPAEAEWAKARSDLP